MSLSVHMELRAPPVEFFSDFCAGVTWRRLLLIRKAAMGRLCRGSPPAAARAAVNTCFHRISRGRQSRLEVVTVTGDRHNTAHDYVNLSARLQVSPGVTDLQGTSSARCAMPRVHVCDTLTTKPRTPVRPLALDIRHATRQTHEYDVSAVRLASLSGLRSGSSVRSTEPVLSSARATSRCLPTHSSHLTPHSTRCARSDARKTGPLTSSGRRRSCRRPWP